MDGGSSDRESTWNTNQEVGGSNPSPRMFAIRWDEKLGDPECPYLQRWVIEIFGYGLRLHHWYRSDDKRAPHDHPYGFVTLVLKGGYTDVSFEYTTDGTGFTPAKDKLRLGSIRYRAAEHSHWVDVNSGGCWTLMLSGRQKRRWGFWVSKRTGFKWTKSNKYFLEHGHHPCDQL